MPEHDPLAQRKIPCQECKGKGTIVWKGSSGTGKTVGNCAFCRGSGQVLESDREWALRNAKIARILVKGLDVVWCACELMGQDLASIRIGDRGECEDCPHMPSESSQCITARLLAAEKAGEKGQHG